MRSPSLKRLKDWFGSSSKVEHFQGKVVDSERSPEVQNHDSWAYNLSSMPAFASDAALWNEKNPCEISLMHCEEVLSESCKKIIDLVANARDKSNDLSKESRLDIFKKAILYSKQILAFGHKEGASVLHDIFQLGLKIESKTLYSPDKKASSFWEMVEGQLSHAKGFEADYTNNHYVAVESRTATFVVMSGIAHNQKMFHAGPGANAFIENFESVTQGGMISQAVIENYREGLIRKLTGATEEHLTE